MPQAYQHFPKPINTCTQWWPSLLRHVLLTCVLGGCKSVSIRLAIHPPGPTCMTAFAGQSRASSALVMIAPVPSSESADIHLMALTADGRRFYLSTQPPGTAVAAAPGKRTPSVLRNVRSRSAIPAPQHQGQSRCNTILSCMLSTS